MDLVTDESDQRRSFIQDFIKTYKLIHQHSQKPINNIKHSQNTFSKHDKKSLSKDAWKSLKLHNTLWRKFFTQILKPLYIKIDEEELLKIAKAILYKEANQCKWYDLPNWAPPVGETYAYYSDWKRKNLLASLFELYNQPSDLIKSSSHEQDVTYTKLTRKNSF